MSLPEGASRKFHRAMLMVAAAWAGGCALLGLTLVNIFPEKMTLLVTTVPNLNMTANLFFALVLVFGVSYYWAALDTPGNISLIRLGIWGKAAVFAFVILGYIQGEASLLTLFGGMSELVFIALFARVLRDLRQVAEGAGYVKVV